MKYGVPHPNIAFFCFIFNTSCARPKGGSQGRAFAATRGFAARGFAATHGRGHVPTTINIRMYMILLFVFFLFICSIALCAAFFKANKDRYKKSRDGPKKSRFAYEIGERYGEIEY